MVFAGLCGAVYSVQGQTVPRIADVQSIIVADSAEPHEVDRRVPLRYPLAERRAGIEAEFITVFVLDTTGRVEMPSVSLVGTVPRAFWQEVCRYLSRMQITPIRRNGQPRRALVVNPFSFALDGGELGRRPRETGEAVRKSILADGVAQAAIAFEPLPHCQ